MKEELLIELKKEFQNKKNENNEYNKKIKRIKELKKDSKVKEFLNLIDLSVDKYELIKMTDRDIITSFYRIYLTKINKGETNKIYVYLGTYKNSNDCDIIHGSDDRVEYNSIMADYRLYQDIEQIDSIIIPIHKCEEFEKENIIINPKNYLKSQTYYKIQEEFFVKAIKENQETAKKYILRKYDRLKK